MEPHPQAAGGNVTALLQLWSNGAEEAFDRLIPPVYDELHRMALRYLSGERSNVSLQPTGLVNEVCLRLLGWNHVRWQNRGHFYGVSAQMMRRVLVDIARRRRAGCRGGVGAVRVPLDGIDVAADEPDADLVAVDDALEKLAAEDARKARVVELRFFGGLSMEETAQTLGVSVRTAHNDWAFAHPLGQTLIVNAGAGRAQRWGGPVEEIRPGDVVWIPPGEKHWHGASPTTAMTHIATGEARREACGLAGTRQCGAVRRTH